MGANRDGIVSEGLCVPSQLASFLVAAFGSPFLVTAAVLAQPVTIPTLQIGNPGNAGDTVVMADGTTGYGAVKYVYEIGVFEITNSQFAAFLNAVGASDPNGLYHTSMGTAFNGGITRSGVDGTYTYAAKAGFEDKPVNYASFFDAARFANWLNNGQPTGPQNVNTTESGTYIMLGPTSIGPGTIDGNGRNSGWLWAIPSEDEWHKAAYGNVGDTYRFYATQSNTSPTAAPPPGSPNSANYGGAVPTLTTVGAYTTSASYWATFDQNGNVAEYNEGDGGARRVRGGSWDDGRNSLPSSERGGVTDGTFASNEVGFRVVRAVVTATTGACCLAGGGCQDNLSQSECEALGGTYQGNGTLCLSVPCGIPVGACCMASGTCFEAVSEIDCQSMGGLYQGDAVTCAAAMCNPLGSIVYVSAGAPAGGDGSSWAQALLSLQAALELATLFPGTVAQIWVAAGTYTPDEGTGDRTASFVLPEHLALYGGFAGGETDPSERDIAANPTILSGDLNGDDGPDFAGNGENSYHVVVMQCNLCPVPPVLDGFTITGGNANQPDNTFNRTGGGVLSAADNAVIANCRFEANFATLRGGGMSDDGLNTTVTNCQFISNATVVRAGGFSSGRHAHITDCVFDSNESDHGGGALATNTTAPIFERCTFSNNSGRGGGGLYVEDTLGIETVQLIDCIFQNNDIWAVYIEDQSSLDALDCIFTENVAGIRNNGGSLSLRHCVFNGNVLAGAVRSAGDFVATNTSFASNMSVANGGGVHINSGTAEVMGCAFTDNMAVSVGGGISVQAGATVAIAGSSFIGNSANYGGGIYNGSFASATLVNCTFSGNIAPTLGGGMYNDGGSATVANSIFWANTTDEITDVAGSTTTVSYSNVEGGFAGTGNIDVNPMFVNPDNDNYRLSPGSACIDAADNTAVPSDEFDLDDDGDTDEPVPFDLDGNPRFVDDPDTPDTGNGKPPIVDMGAYELQVGDDDDSDDESDDDSSDDSDDDSSDDSDDDSDDSSSDDSSSGAAPPQAQGVDRESPVLSIPDDVASCPKDINRDGIVNVVDLGDLLLCLGQPAVPGCESEDVNTDGSVDVLDLIELLLAFGTACP